MSVARSSRGQAASVRRAQAQDVRSQGSKAVLKEFVPAYDPELGHYFVGRPPSLIERLVQRVVQRVAPGLVVAPVVKRGRGRPRKSGGAK
jgi:hypothetical protein